MTNKEKLEKIIEKINRNKRVGSFPQLPENESQLIRKYFKSIIPLPIGGLHLEKIFNSEETLIAEGYNRIVIGDYGAYLEFSDNQIQKDNIEPRWEGKPKRKVKYIWMQTNDQEATKIYWQQDIVDYADYKIGMYYMDILDAYTS